MLQMHVRIYGYIQPMQIVMGILLSCRLQNVFVIGKGDKPLISLPKGKGVRLTILQEQSKIYNPKED